MARRSYKFRGATDCPIAVYYSQPLFPLSHWHPEVELMLVTTGTIHCRLEDQDHHLVPGDILVLNPNQLHTIVKLSEDHRCINVIFSLEAIALPKPHIFQESFVAPLSESRLQLPNLLRPDHPAHGTVKALMEKMREGNLYRDETRFFRYTGVVAMCAALQPYCTLTGPAVRRQAPEDKTVRKVMFYIHNCYSKPMPLAEIAAHVHLHPNYLSAVFKAQTGHTITEHIAQTRVDAAKFLLRRDALPMARVAELTGFSSERAFYRQFQKYTGMTPKTYQLQQQG